MGLCRWGGYDGVFEGIVIIKPFPYTREVLKDLAGIWKEYSFPNNKCYNPLEMLGHEKFLMEHERFAMFKKIKAIATPQ